MILILRIVPETSARVKIPLSMHYNMTPFCGATLPKITNPPLELLQGKMEEYKSD